VSFVVTLDQERYNSSHNDYDTAITQSTCMQMLDQAARHLNDLTETDGDINEEDK